VVDGSASTLTPEQAQAILYAAWTEDDLLRFVRNTAGALDYAVYHTKYSLRSDAGFPDLVLCHRKTGRTVFAELKREGKWPTLGRVNARGRWTSGQKEWLGWLARDNECYLWWPSDQHDVAQILMDGPGPGMACTERLTRYLRGERP